MRLAVAQLDTSALAPGDAARRLLESARMASDSGAKLVLCPYAALSYPVSLDTSDQIDYALELAEAVASITQEAPCPMLLCGGVDMNGFSGSVALFIHDGVVEPVSVGVRARSMVGVASGFSVDGVRFAVACTYDDLDKLAESEDDADAVVFASSHGFVASDALSAMAVGYSEGYLSDLAKDLDTWLIGVASLGGYGEDIYCGASYVCAPWGELAASAPAFEEYLLVHDLDITGEGPLENLSEPAYFDRPLMMWLALSLGLADNLRALGQDDAIVALDGGLVSSLCCVLASDALGPTHVHALVPCTLDEVCAARARSVAETLGVVLHVPDDKLMRLVNDEAMVSRVAQLELARLAGKLPALPLVALDKTGLALELDGREPRTGWLAPFGDVYRLDLVELGRLRNTISPVVPREVLRDVRVPGIAGLDEVSATARGRLEFVDMALMSRVEGGRTPSELVHTYGHAPAIDAIVKRLSDTAPARRGVEVLRASARTLSDILQPLGLVWRNGSGREDVSERIEAILSRLVAGEIPVADEAQVREVIGLINDLAESMPTPVPRPNPLMWGMPFSEN